MFWSALWGKDKQSTSYSTDCRKIQHSILIPGTTAGDWWRRLLLKSKLKFIQATGHSTVKMSTTECRLLTATMDIPTTLQRHPASSPLTTEAHQFIVSVGSISLPCFLCLALNLPSLPQPPLKKITIAIHKMFAWKHTSVRNWVTKEKPNKMMLYNYIFCLSLHTTSEYI